MTQIVGILNITPDSFSDGGDFFDAEKAIARAEQLFLGGTDIVDVGAESTRPNATTLTWKDEWARLEPVLRILLPLYPGKISLDTYHPEIIRKAFEIGPVIVNDVTGMNNPDMVDVVTILKSTVIISHLPDQDIQAAHNGELISDINIVKKDLLQKAKMLESMGLQREQIILDPGIGFGKTTELNFGLLKFAELVPEYKVMIGYSRKRFLGEKRMEIVPNLEAGKIAVTAGAAYIRVHDVIGHTVLAQV